MSQYDLFGGIPPHVKNSDTSLSAANSISKSAESIRNEIFKFMKSSGFKVTCDDIEYALGIKHQTASARIRELVLKNKIMDSGVRKKTRSGRNAVVYCEFDKNK